MIGLRCASLALAVVAFIAAAMQLQQDARIAAMFVGIGLVASFFVPVVWWLRKRYGYED